MSGHTPSWDLDKSKDHYEGKTYYCEDCNARLQDNECYMIGSYVYCGTCYQGK